MFINSLFFKLTDLVENSPAKRDRLILFPLVFSVLLVAIAAIVIPISFWEFKDYIVLHYNIYFGISSLGPWPMLWLLPLSGLLILFINAILSIFLYLKNNLLSYFLSFAAAAYNLFVLIAIILIIYINI